MAALILGYVSLMLLRQIFDPQLAHYAYLVGCQQSENALIIDPERDIDRYRERRPRRMDCALAQSQRRISMLTLSAVRKSSRRIVKFTSTFPRWVDRIGRTGGQGGDRTHIFSSTAIGS